ncbi:fructose-1 6-bisphosphatase [Corynebacterium lactis RW2-5]|uniref:Inositol-1-monophosphatase n=2 Tax=Corynebacterium lactis TaxID=1231000 RepID=A0A0K2GZT6_9CORY|nr:fructose-1 6-bisphosphatase [Corynebacterium lactis RW2-5]
MGGMDPRKDTPELPATALRDIAVVVAGAAARHIALRRNELGHDGVSATAATKSSDVDPVTVVDRESEQLIRRLLSNLAPGSEILGEEEGRGSASVAGRKSPITWIVDPIDGTVNFLYGIPAYAVSIACAVDSEIVAGVVVNVATGETYSAAAGKGATLTFPDGRRETLGCGSALSLGQALIATGFSYSSDLRRVQGEVAAYLLPRCRDIRRMGSAALDLCAVARGAVDAYYEHGIKIWDWAAGALIAKEAGAQLKTPVLAGALNAKGIGDGDALENGVFACEIGIAETFLDTCEQAIDRARSVSTGS